MPASKARTTLYTDAAAGDDRLAADVRCSLHTQACAELGDKGLVVLGMTREDDKSIAEFVTRFPMQFHVGTDVDGAFFKRLAMRAMPYAVLTDRNGVVIWQGDPGQLNRARIEAALVAPGKNALTCAGD